jgi:hypothetical protein
MAQRFDQGFLSHTTTARPFWDGDVDVSRLHAAPRLYQVGTRRMAGPSSLRSRIARLIGSVTGR